MSNDKKNDVLIVEPKTEKEKKEVSLLSRITGEVSEAPDVSNISEKELNYLSAVMDKMHRNEYKHVVIPERKILVRWFLLNMLLGSFQEYFIEATPLDKALYYSLSSVAGPMLTASSLALFSRMFTRLYNYNVILYKVLQLYFIFKIFFIVSPLSTYFNNWIDNAEAWFNIPCYCALPFLMYGLTKIFIPTRWLKRSSLSYLVISLFVLGYLLVDSEVIRHELMEDNQVVIFSDFGSGFTQKTKVIPSMVDEITSFE